MNNHQIISKHSLTWFGLSQLKRQNIITIGVTANPSSLLTNVEQLLDEQHKSAFCSSEATLQDAVDVMCKTGFGLIAIVDQGNLQGVFTDGDLRRAFANGVTANMSISNWIKKDAFSVQQSSLCIDALTLMSENAISALPVLSDDGMFVGVVNLHTIQKAGIY